MITKHEQLLVAVLQGRTEEYGPNMLPAELRSDDPRELEYMSDLTDESVCYEVKALMSKLGKNLLLLRNLMSGRSRWQETFTKNVNEVLVRIAQLERAKEEEANRKALSVQKTEHKKESANG